MRSGARWQTLWSSVEAFANSNSKYRLKSTVAKVHGIRVTAETRRAKYIKICVFLDLQVTQLCRPFTILVICLFQMSVFRWWVC